MTACSGKDTRRHTSVRVSVFIFRTPYRGAGRRRRPSRHAVEIGLLGQRPPQFTVLIGNVVGHDVILIIA